jgi:hypothetical protein
MILADNDVRSRDFRSALDPLFQSDVILVKDRPTQAFLAAMRRMEYDQTSLPPKRRGRSCKQARIETESAENNPLTAMKQHSAPET